MVEVEELKSIFIRKRGKKYYVYLEYIDPTTGKPKQKSQGSFEKKKDAQALLVKLKHNVISDKFIMPSSITFVDYVAEHINLNEDAWSPYTVEAYRTMLKKTLIPYFGNLEIQKLTPLILQDFYNDLIKKYSMKYTRLYHSLVGATLGKAYRLRLIEKNPCDFVELPKKKDDFESKACDRAQAKNIISASEGHVLEIPILLAITLGLRRSEICGLTWDNIDFKEGTLTVEKTMYVKNGEYIFKEPKTASSKRTISVPNGTLQRLKTFKRNQSLKMLKGGLHNPDNLICFNKRNNPVTPSYLSKTFAKFIEDNGFEHMRFHDLRHTNVSLMLLDKTDAKIISTRIGHASIKTTMDIYGHVLQESDVEVSKNLDSVLFG